MFPMDIAAMVAAAVMAFGAGSVAIASRRSKAAKREHTTPEGESGVSGSADDKPIQK
jgi:hypothetical protein